MAGRQDSNPWKQFWFGEQGEEISISQLLLLWVEPFEHSVLPYPEDLCADGHSWNYGFATSVMPQDM